MTEDEILDGLIDREGGFRPQTRRPDGTIDPDTMYGVTAPVLGNWRGLTRPASRTEILALQKPEAKEIFYSRYILQPGFTKQNIRYEPLRVQLIDFGVNSGPERALRWLQRVMQVPATGVLDARTEEAFRDLLGDWGGYRDTIPRLLNDALVAARCYMIDRAVDTGTMRKADEEGVESRALSFFLAKP